MNWKEALNNIPAKGYRQTKNGKYEAYISDHSKTIMLGTHNTIDEARNAVFNYRANRLINGVKKYGLDINDGVIYEDNYLAFDNGIIFNLHGERMMGGINKSGYRQGIFNGHHRDHHRIIADCFIDNPNNLRDVNHKNGIKLDLDIRNLERTTHADNIKHAYETGLERKVFGEDHHNHKLTEEDVRYIRSCDLSSYALARELRVDSSTIRDIRTRRTWRNVE